MIYIYGPLGASAIIFSQSVKALSALGPMMKLIFCGLVFVLCILLVLVVEVLNEASG